MHVFKLLAAGLLLAAISANAQVAVDARVIDKTLPDNTVLPAPPVGPGVRLTVDQARAALHPSVRDELVVLTPYFDEIVTDEIAPTAADFVELTTMRAGDATLRTVVVPKFRLIINRIIAIPNIDSNVRTRLVAFVSFYLMFRYWDLIDVQYHLPLYRFFGLLGPYYNYCWDAYGFTCSLKYTCGACCLGSWAGLAPVWGVWGWWWDHTYVFSPVLARPWFYWFAYTWVYFKFPNCAPNIFNWWFVNAGAPIPLFPF